MKPNGLKLSALFILVNILCSVVSFTVLFLLTSAAYRLGLLRPTPYMQIVTLALMGFCSGSLLAALALKKILEPFRRFSDESDRIAKGDFSIRCDAGSPIAEVRQIAQNLNAMVEELGTVESLREEFIAGVSHELKTPLAVMEGYAALLGEPSLPPEEQRRYAGEIRSGCRRLSGLVSRLLWLSSLENRTQLPDCREFSLDEQLRECLVELEPCWSQKDIHLSLDLPPVRCTGCPELCRQIWLNLYTNAFRYTPDHGTVTTRLRAGTGDITVCVGDTGPGMSPEVQKHIFEKFYQGDPSHSSGGSGLGLALVRRIVLLHGGTVSVRSAPGEGSVFTVTLPAAQSGISPALS